MEEEGTREADPLQTEGEAPPAEQVKGACALYIAASKSLKAMIVVLAAERRS